MPAEERISAFHYQSLRRSISATAYPLAKPFDGERPDILCLCRKMRTRHSHRSAASKSHPVRMSTFSADLPNMLHSHTLKLSTTRARVPGQPRHPSPLRAIFGVPNWSCGGGGAAEGGTTVNKRREEEYVRKQTHFWAWLRDTPQREPVVGSS